MSIDKIVSKIRELDYSGIDLTKENLIGNIQKKLTYTPNSSKLYVLMPSWGGKIKYTEKLSKKIKEEGNSSLAYQFPRKILTSDYKLTRDYFKIIRNHVLEDIENFQTECGFSDFHMIGVSIGCVNATMVTNSDSRFNKATFVVPGNCLADSLWKGYRTQFLRKEFESKGIDLERLKEEWRELAPENNLRNLKNAKVKVYFSSADLIIPSRNGKKLVNKMEEVGINPKVRKIPIAGHYGTIFAFYKFPRMFKIN